MRSAEIKVGEEYGIRRWNGIQKGRVEGFERIKDWGSSTARLKVMVAGISTVGDHDQPVPVEPAKVLGLWVDHPEWQRLIDAKAESKEVADRLRALLPEARVGNLTDRVTIDLTNAEARRLVERLDS